MLVLKFFNLKIQNGCHFFIFEVTSKPSTHYRSGILSGTIWWKPFLDIFLILYSWRPICFFDHYQFHLGPTTCRDQDEYMWEVSWLYAFSGFRGIARRTKKLTDGRSDGRWVSAIPHQFSAVTHTSGENN